MRMREPWRVSRVAAAPRVSWRGLSSTLAAIAPAAENTLLDAAERGDRAAALRLLTQGRQRRTRRA